MAQQPSPPKSAHLSDLEYVSEGGSGQVYRARHESYGCVAVKIARNGRADTVRQFLREYQILRSLRHRGICAMWDLGWLASGRPFTVMEWLGGGSLYRYTDQCPETQRFLGLGRLLAAVKYLHDLGIIHRDLKGENVLLDNENQPTLTDLGLAAAEGSVNGRSGTLEYMAPEVIDGATVTLQSDIYSLGVMLYRIATGELPFLAEDPLHVVGLKRDPGRINFGETLCAYPERFVEVVRKCLEPDPDARFKSVSHLAYQLTAAGVLPRRAGAQADTLNLLHYHLSGYNLSFVDHELKTPDADYLIIDNHQAEASGLWRVLADKLKANRCEVLWSTANSIKYRNGNSQRIGTIARAPLSPGGSEIAEVAYPELSHHTLRVILEKLFKAGIDEKAVDLIYQYSFGNLCLLPLVIRGLERDGLLEERATGKRLSLPATYEFSPPSEYFATIAKWVPEMPDELKEPLYLLAVDLFGSSRQALLNRRLLDRPSLEALVNEGILRRDDYCFRTTYLREFFYGQLPPRKKVDLHLQWVTLIMDDELLTSFERSERLFYHYSRTGDAAAAAREALALSEILEKRNSPEEARDVAAKARALPNLRRHRNLYLQLLMRSADLAKAAGQFDRALSEYALIVRLAHRYQERELLAEAYKDLGDVYKAKGSYRRGTRVLQRALALYRDLNDELELSHCYNNMGNIDWMAGNLDKAEANYLEALKIQRRLGAKRDTASTLSNLAGVRAIRFMLDESVSYYKEAIAIFRELDEMGELARAANNLAVVSLWQDKLSAALEHLQESLKINGSLRAEKELLFNYENVAEANYLLGDLKSAREALYAGMRMAPLSDHLHRGVYITKLALTFMAQGHYHRAGKLLQLASKHERQVTDLMFSLELAIALSRYHVLMFNLDQAASLLDEARKSADRLGDLKKKLNLLLLAGRVERADALKKGETPKSLREAETILKENALRREQLLLHLDLTDYFLCAGETESAAQSLARAAACPVFDGSHILLARAKYLEGLLMLRADRPERAEVLLNQSAEIAEELTDPEQRWRALAALGETHAGLTKYESALKCYLQAYDILRDLAGSISSEQQRRTYLSEPSKLRIAEEMEKLTALAT